MSQQVSISVDEVPDDGTGPVRISCVVPTHGRPDLLAEALAGVLAQTRPVAEVVVVSDDDGAAVGEVVVGVAATTSIPLHHHVREVGPSGASASRNLGAARATGDLLAFLDDDDVWEPGYLESVAAALSDAGADAAGSRWTTFGPADEATVSRRFPTLDVQDVFLYGTPALGSNLVIRRDVFDALGGYDVHLRHHNDADLMARLLEAGHTYVHLDDVLVRVRKHGRGQLSDRSSGRADGMVQVYEKHAASMTRLTRRHFRLRIHRMRYDSATDPLTRGRHLLGMAANFNRSRFVDRRWLRHLPGVIRRPPTSSPR